MPPRLWNIRVRKRDEEAAWEQTQVLMQGVVDLAAELGEVGFRYKAQNEQGLGTEHWLVPCEYV